MIQNVGELVWIGDLAPAGLSMDVVYPLILILWKKG